jgi:putative ABC transport system permease protein
VNLFQLVFKQMRQRALGTWLTLLSVVLGVALATAVMLVRRESEQLFGQSDYGYDLVVGPKGSKLQLVLNTVYHVDVSPGNIAYSFYETLANPRNPQAKIAVPYAVGDTYKGHRIVGTLPKLFGATDDGSALPAERVLEYRPGRRYEFAQGRAFHSQKFEAVIGSEVAKTTGLGIGGKFHATHGMPAPGQQEDVHDEQWEVVGVLKPTHTANDNVLFIPLVSFYAIQEHEEGLKAQQNLEAAASGRAPEKPEGHEAHEEHYTLNPDGTIHLDIPKEAWKVSAVLVKSRGGFQVQQLIYNLNNSPLPVMAVNPATVMREFFNTFLRGSTLLLLAVSALVSIVAAVGILVSIYNSVSARMKEIAILRALGATRAKVLTLICLEAGLIGLLGGILGLVAGHALAGIGSVYFRQTLGEGINWLKPDAWEAVYLGGVVVIAVLAGLVPALKAYRTPVATNLVAT